MNQNWPRWIFASVSKWFNANIDQTILPMFVEGMDRDTEGKVKWCELRIDGPDGYETSKGCWYLFIDINILISILREEKDIHIQQRMNGLVAAAFTGCIPIYQYGAGPGEGTDPTLMTPLEYMGLIDSRDGTIKIDNFGQTETDVPVMQSSVAARYKVVLTE